MKIILTTVSNLKRSNCFYSFYSLEGALASLKSGPSSTYLYLSTLLPENLALSFSLVGGLRTTCLCVNLSFAFHLLVLLKHPGTMPVPSSLPYSFSNLNSLGSRILYQVFFHLLVRSFSNLPLIRPA